MLSKQQYKILVKLNKKSNKKADGRLDTKEVEEILRNNMVCFGNKFSNGFLSDDYLDGDMLRKYIHIYLLDVGLDELIKENTNDNTFFVNIDGNKAIGEYRINIFSKIKLPIVSIVISIISVIISIAAFCK